MKTLGILLLSLLLMSACTGAATTVQRRDDVQMTLTIVPNPPSVGMSELVIALTDANGQALDGAQLDLIGTMNHEGMAAIEATINSSEDGIYRLPFEWTMGGEWTLNVHATLAQQGGYAEANFDVFVEAVSQNSAIHQHSSTNDANND